jgi:hypothetical protein
VGPVIFQAFLQQTNCVFDVVPLDLKLPQEIVGGAVLFELFEASVVVIVCLIKCLHPLVAAADLEVGPVEYTLILQQGPFRYDLLGFVGVPVPEEEGLYVEADDMVEIVQPSDYEDFRFSGNLLEERAQFLVVVLLEIEDGLVELKIDAAVEFLHVLWAAFED